MIINLKRRNYMYTRDLEIPRVFLQKRQKLRVIQLCFSKMLLITFISNIYLLQEC